MIHNQSVRLHTGQIRKHVSAESTTFTGRSSKKLSNSLKHNELHQLFLRPRMTDHLVFACIIKQKALLQNKSFIRNYAWKSLSICSVKPQSSLC